MKSAIVKRSIVIAGHKTSVSLEESFWKGLKEIALYRGLTLSEMVAIIDSERAHANLSSAIRLSVLDHFCTAARKPTLKENTAHNLARHPPVGANAG